MAVDLKKKVMANHKKDRFIRKLWKNFPSWKKVIFIIFLVNSSFDDFTKNIIYTYYVYIIYFYDARKTFILKSIFMKYEKILF